MLGLAHLRVSGKVLGKGPAAALGVGRRLLVRAEAVAGILPRLWRYIWAESDGALRLGGFAGRALH